MSLLFRASRQQLRLPQSLLPRSLLLPQSLANFSYQQQTQQQRRQHWGCVLAAVTATAASAASSTTTAHASDVGYDGSRYGLRQQPSSQNYRSLSGVGSRGPMPGRGGRPATNIVIYQQEPEAQPDGGTPERQARPRGTQLQADMPDWAVGQRRIQLQAGDSDRGAHQQRQGGTPPHGGTSERAMQQHGTPPHGDVLYQIARQQQGKPPHGGACLSDGCRSPTQSRSPSAARGVAASPHSSPQVRAARAMLQQLPAHHALRAQDQRGVSFLRPPGVQSSKRFRKEAKAAVGAKRQRAADEGPGVERAPNVEPFAAGVANARRPAKKRKRGPMVRSSDASLKTVNRRMSAFSDMCLGDINGQLALCRPSTLHGIAPTPANGPSAGRVCTNYFSPAKYPAVFFNLDMSRKQYKGLRRAGSTIL